MRLRKILFVKIRQIFILLFQIIFVVYKIF